MHANRKESSKSNNNKLSTNRNSTKKWFSPWAPSLEVTKRGKISFDSVALPLAAALIYIAQCAANIIRVHYVWTACMNVSSQCECVSRKVCVPVHSVRTGNMILLWNQPHSSAIFMNENRVVVVAVNDARSVHRQCCAVLFRIWA